MSLFAFARGIVSRILPAANADQLEASLRLGRYGEAAVISIVRTKHPLADEGAYFSTQNPTLGTALGAGVLASFSDTVAALVFQNTADPAAGNAKNIYLDFIKLAFTVVPASATGMRYAVKLDNGGSRAPTGGAAKIVGQGGSPGASPVGSAINGSIANAWAFTGGAFMTVPASIAARVVALGGIGALPVVGSEFMIRFGSDGANSGSTAGGTSHAAPVVIPPGYFAVAHIWFPSNSSTGASAELDIGWWER